ncbi:MAG TPA: universal stress protein [Longimicrobiales bacterium]|nr:universal stress protein [Longimicrobiales bacterium]
MFKAILVPLDGSASAEEALRPAATIARKAGAPIHLVNAAVLRAGGDFDIEVGELDPRYLEEVAERLRRSGVATVSCEVVSSGDVASALEEHRIEVGADLTVMATHGRGGVARTWLGSIADRFVRTTETPVLLLRAGASESTDEDLATDVLFNRVLVPLDGSSLSAAALAPATELGGGGDSVYILLRIIDPPHALGSPWLPNAVATTEAQLRKAREEAEAELRSVTESFGAQGYNVEPVAEFATPVAQGILEIAESHHADVIAIATHGRGGLSRAVLGSVTDKVVRGADHPVLVVRPLVV